ncbi:MAG: DUF547 domain-containing protein [Thermoanaerobaculia bacterium]
MVFIHAVFLAVPLWCAEKPITSFPLPLDSGGWTRLLRKNVDDRGLVDYSAWKSSREDLQALDAYLEKFASPGGRPSPAEKIALLINAYNAFIVRTVLDHFPTDSIRSIPGAFTSKTHALGGRRCSLDEIEHTAVALGGYRVHATIVCASKSCPPLDRRAYEASDLVTHEEDRMRAWMARSDLYRFEPAKNVAWLPKYFVWYRSDFEKEGIPAVLSAYAPGQYRRWLAAGGFRIEYLDYDWALNDVSARRAARTGDLRREDFER